MPLEKLGKPNQKHEMNSVMKKGYKRALNVFE